MQQQTPAPGLAAKGEPYSPRQPAASLNGEDKRRIFKGMVVSELEAGFLRYSSRKKLLRYASRLGIHEFEAALLIAEAQFYSDRIEPIHFDAAATFETVTRPETWSASMRLTFALVTAVFVDLLVIYWLFV